MAMAIGPLSSPGNTGRSPVIDPVLRHAGVVPDIPGIRVTGGPSLHVLFIMSDKFDYFFASFNLPLVIQTLTSLMDIGENMILDLRSSSVKKHQDMLKAVAHSG